MSNTKRTREHKSNSFALLLREKAYALEIYNALNDTDYDDPELVEVIDVEGVFRLSVQGDAEFLLQNMLNLYEHQSTKNPNMPIRFLILVSDMYRDMIKKSKIFGRKLVKIPNPRFVVFYNGKENVPEREVLKLSDAYINEEKDCSLELKCLCININPGYNDKIKEKSEALTGYMNYVEKVKRYSKTMTPKRAVIKAVDECIKEGILKEFFMANRRLIVSRDPIDGTYETRLKMVKEEYRLIIKNKDKELAENKKELAVNKKELAERDSKLAEKDKIIEELMRKLENKS